MNTFTSTAAEGAAASVCSVCVGMCVCVCARPRVQDKHDKNECPKCLFPLGLHAVSHVGASVQSLADDGRGEGEHAMPTSSALLHGSTSMLTVAHGVPPRGPAVPPPGSGTVTVDDRRQFYAALRQSNAPQAPLREGEKRRQCPTCLHRWLVRQPETHERS